MSVPSSTLSLIGRCICWSPLLILRGHFGGVWTIVTFACHKMLGRCNRCSMCFVFVCQTLPVRE